MKTASKSTPVAGMPILWMALVVLGAFVFVAMMQQRSVAAERDNVTYLALSAHQQSLAHAYVQDVALHLAGLDADPAARGAALTAATTALVEGGPVEGLHAGEGEPLEISPPSGVALRRQANRIFVLMQDLTRRGDQLIEAGPGGAAGTELQEMRGVVEELSAASTELTVALTDRSQSRLDTLIKLDWYRTGAAFVATLLVLVVLWRLTRRTASREWEAITEHQSLHDGLTGLPNRDLFHDRLTHAVSTSGMESEIGVLLLDIDNFKDVNDSAGHLVGDELLMAIADRLKSCIGQNGTVARLGGDEFAVLFDKLVSHERVVASAGRILEAIREPIEVIGRTVTVTASIGVVVVPGGSASPELILRDADLAMYAAKENGRDQYSMFRNAMHEVVRDRAELRDELAVALTERQLHLEYQVIIDLESRKAKGHEALVRWRHPERGVVPPGDFIPLAERTGLIHDLGRYVLVEACEALHTMDDLDPSAYISVNVSPLQIARPDYVDEVRDVVTGAGIDPGRLVLEITESTLADLESILPRLHELREFGVRLAVDDFGTGYSSLSYLQELPVDILKIDRSFVDMLGRWDGRGDALVRSIIRLAGSLDLAVVAEGVETQDQLDLLLELGCELGQGYFFSRPVTLEESVETAAELAADRAVAALQGLKNLQGMTGQRTESV